MTCGCFSVDQSAPPERDRAAERAAWLESLEPGDTVAVLNLTSLSERYGCTIRQIHEISSVQRQISLYGISIRFDRRGRSYNGGNIMLAPVTDEVLVHVRRMKLVREIQNWDPRQRARRSAGEAARGAGRVRHRRAHGVAGPALQAEHGARPRPA